MSAANIALIAVLITLNGFFVGVEFAAVASRRARLDMLDEANSRAMQIVHTWLDQPAARDRLIAASQLGITVVSLALGAAGENAFEAWLEPYFQVLALPAALQFLETILPAIPLVLSLTLVTSLHVVLGEQVPKVAVLRAPERFALFAAPIMRVFSTVFKWFIDVLDWATRQILEMIGISSGDMHSPTVSLEELRQMVSGPEVEGVIDPPEREMLSAIIDFGELLVRQVSVPRTGIIAVEASTPLPEVVQTAIQHAVTKFPVYEENLDHVVGILHLRDLMGAMHRNGSDPNRTARDLAREALFVPETISVNDLLHQFRTRRMHMAIVLDEFGGTAGLVTLEDLLEEIVGEVRDPFDSTPPTIQPLPDGSALLEGLALIEEVNEYFGLHLIDPYYDTIAGYVLGKLGRIPQTGDSVEDSEQGIQLKVDGMDHLRIARILLTRLK